MVMPDAARTADREGHAKAGEGGVRRHRWVLHRLLRGSFCPAQASEVAARGYRHEEAVRGRTVRTAVISLGDHRDTDDTSYVEQVRSSVEPCSVLAPDVHRISFVD